MGGAARTVQGAKQAVVGGAQRLGTAAVGAVKADIGNKIKMGQAIAGGVQRSVNAVGSAANSATRAVGGAVNSATRRIGQEVEISRKVGAGEPLNKPTIAAKPAPPASTGGMSAQNLAAYKSGGGNAAAQRGMGSSTAQVIAQGKKNLGRMDQGSGRSTLTQSFDPFDVVLGHLIDEGYADTEEAALKIMANMSEEWKESIVEEVLDERNRGERDMIDLQVRDRRDRRDGDRSAGGFKPYVRAGGNQRSEHEGNRGKKKVKGRVGASMRGPNDNVSNYHASSEEN